jgi:hypothetical protein
MRRQGEVAAHLKLDPRSIVSRHGMLNPKISGSTVRREIAGDAGRNGATATHDEAAQVVTGQN